MNRLHSRATVLVATLAATTAIAACSSSSVAGSGNGPASGPASATTSPNGPSTTPPASPTGGGGRTMSPPHIVCYQHSVTKIYDGADTRPVELCLRIGTDVNLVITPPSGASWALPTVAPAGRYPATPSRSGASVTIKIQAVRRGTAIVTVPKTSWQLRIAVI